VRASRLVPIAACLAIASVAAQPALTTGSPAPSFARPDLSGRMVSLAAYRGRVVLLDFWATWCAPCRAEMPLLNRFYLEHRAQGLALVGVSVDDQDERAAVVEIMRQFSYPAVLAAGAKADGFGPPLAVPMTWIIDTRGVVRARLVSGNAVTLQALTQAVVPLLPPAPAGAH